MFVEKPKDIFAIKTFNYLVTQYYNEKSSGPDYFFAFL